MMSESMSESVSMAELAGWARAAGVPATLLDPAALTRILAHWARVEETGRIMNLTALKGRAGFVRLVVDSATAARVYDGRGPAVDIGTGAGYPGLVLAALYPASRWVLVDSVGKKARFVAGAATALGLDQVAVRPVRAEALAATDGGRFQFAVARAAGALPVVAELALPLLAVGGTALLMRGPAAAEELPAAAALLTRLGAVVDRVETLDLPEDQGRRALVVIKKAAPSGTEFPRHGARLGTAIPGSEDATALE